MTSESETVTRSKSAPATDASAVRPTLSLRNQEGGLGASFQSAGPLVPPNRFSQRIWTYYPWSIVNLLFLPFGILCCYFSHKVKQLKMQNRQDAAKKMSHRTLVLNMITTLLMFGVAITIAMLRYDYDKRNEVVVGNVTRTTAPVIPWQPGR